MAIIRQRASLRVKKFYENALLHHNTLSREAVLIILRKIKIEMLALDNGIPDGCHIVNPSYLSLWNERGWTDVSSIQTRWHYVSLTTEFKRLYTTQSILRIWQMKPTVLYRSARLQIWHNRFVFATSNTLY